MEIAQEITAAAERLPSARSDDEWIEIVRTAAPELNRRRADEYELCATRLAVARKDTAAICIRVLGRIPDADSEIRFLIFAMGAIACRRAQDKRLGDDLFELMSDEFAGVPLFKHFLALSLDEGKKRELRRGLDLERKVLPETAPHAGAAHLIARFILKLRDCDDPTIGDPELREALDAVGEAIELRPGYAKFYATRAAVYRQLGRFDEATEDLLDAIRLEDRNAIDVQDRIGDYKHELLSVEVHRNLGSIGDKVTALEGRTQRTVERLRNAELSVITAVAFVAGILSLVQITLTNINGRSVWASVLIVASFAVILFGAIGFGAWLLRRPWSEGGQPVSDEIADDVD
jgi:tetratricopeptide (TPR) repeat protein